MTASASPFALARPLLDLILPPRCPACGAMVEDDLQFCGDCWGQLRFVTEPMCRSCCRPLGADHAGGMICGPCLAKPPPHDGVRAAVIYDDLSRQIVLKLKHGGKIGLARLIARHLDRHIPAERDALLLAAVPLHRWRLWRRGFNQSILIARELARTHSLPFDDSLIGRSTATPPLKGLSAKERAKLMRGVFALRPDRAGAVSGRHVLLVDDVYTSGATSHACVKLLKKAGAEKVTILCWARVLRDGEIGGTPSARESD